MYYHPICEIKAACECMATYVCGGSCEQVFTHTQVQRQRGTEM